MADEKEEKKGRPHLRNMLRDMAENSTIHGIPKIASSQEMYIKIMWSFLFLGTSAYLCFILYQLFDNYYSWPTKTTVSLEFSNLPFPAISFCNWNPVKKSMIHRTSPEIMKYIHPHQSFTDFSYYEAEEDIHGDEGSGDIEHIKEMIGSDHWTFEDEILFEELGRPRDMWFDRVDKFKTEFKKISREDRARLGHNISDMLVSCTYNTRLCGTENFTAFQDINYGNCYTLKSERLITRRPGPMRGLVLTLNLEIPEYITTFMTGYGTQLIIHEPNQMVFPRVEGITLSPGYETVIALKMVNVTRLGSPYGKCETGKEFEETFGFKYTQSACIQMCKQRKIVDLCGCVPHEVDVEYGHSHEDHEHLKATNDSLWCDPTNSEYQFCQLRVDAMYLKGQLDCVCESPCQEVIYEKTISGRPWANKSFLRYGLVNDLCHRKNLSYLQVFCEAYRKNKDMDVDNMKDHFLRVKIFYEDLNYEVIIEKPMYNWFRFVSDIGGTLGLFIGASVLSAFEILQLVAEILNYFRKRLFHHLSAKIANRKTET